MKGRLPGSRGDLRGLGAFGHCRVLAVALALLFAASAVLARFLALFAAVLALAFLAPRPRRPPGR